MITEDVTTTGATYTLRCRVVEENNAAFLLLDSLEYTCTNCRTNTLVDLSLVPAHNIALKCGKCGNSLCDIEEEQFKRKLIVEEALCVTL